MDLNSTSTLSDSRENVMAAPLIHRLSDHLINQIAAGEVVERPSSVVKELVENSLDARASRIEIHLKEGGIDEISILDDGTGMSAEDLQLSVERHATSKIKAEIDLDQIGTFGFRGEALASIASVSEMEIRSRTETMQHANVISVSYGKMETEARPVGAPPGTLITVKRLFAKVPARQKFLRSSGTELAHCTRVAKELALGNPGKRFAVYHNTHLLHQFVATTREERFCECLKVKWSPLHLAQDSEGARLEAYLSPREQSRTRGELFLFVNGRAVKNRTLLAAVRNAYQDILGAGHDPSGIVFLDIRKDWVDVNVHPQKLEVRCFKQEMIYSWLTVGVRKLLSQATPLKPHSHLIYPTEIKPNRVDSTPPSGSFAAQPRAQKIEQPRVFNATPASPLPKVNVPSPQNPLLQNAAPRFLGQLKNQVLIVEDSEGLCLIDARGLNAHSALEEIRLRQEQGNYLPSSLALPLVISLAPSLQSTWMACQALFQQMGFESEIFGEGDIAIKTRPTSFPEHEIELFLKRVLQRLSEIDPSQRADLFLHELAKHISRNTTQSVNRLITYWRQLPSHEQRRFVMHLSYPQLEKHLGRTEEI